MAAKYLEWLDIYGIGQKLPENVFKGLKWLEMADNRYKCLEITVMDGNVWTLQETYGIAEHVQKQLEGLELTGNCWTWLEMAGMAKKAGNCWRLV